MRAFRGFAALFCRRVAAPVVVLLLVLTLAPSRARAQEAITEDLNTAAPGGGSGGVGANLGFKVADANLAARKERLSPSTRFRRATTSSSTRYRSRSGRAC